MNMPANSNTRRTLPAAIALLVFVLLSFSASLTGYFFPPGEWYASLNRPAFAPPNWVFGPVWTVLYILIALSGWLVWRQVGWRSRQVALWGVQMLLNALWTPLFFGLNWLALAAVEMALLWIAILACMAAFRHVSTTASWLMAPYLLWVSFALLLNLGFWWLN